jgi:hypothetical protein
MNNNWKDDLNFGLAAFGVQIPDGTGTIGSLDAVAAKLVERPAATSAAVVALSSLLYYAAERGRNPKVHDLGDAMMATSTCLNVGYGDVYAKTPVGKIISTLLMTYGPSLANVALDGQAAAQRDAAQAEILRTLQQILEKLPVPPVPSPSTPGTR